MVAKPPPYIDRMAADTSTKSGTERKLPLPVNGRKKNRTAPSTKKIT